MNRRVFLKNADLGAAALGLPVHSALSQAKGTRNMSGKRPNIIFLLSDDQCIYSVGCCGKQALLKTGAPAGRKPMQRQD